MRKVLVVSLVLALLTLARISQATSVDARPVNCPICGKEFERLVLMSYSRFGSPARDFSDCLRPAWLTTCPYCLYTGNFDDELGPEKKAALKQVLTTMISPLADQVRRDLGCGLERHELASLVPILIARRCDEAIGSGLDHDIGLLQRAHASTLHEPDSQAHHYFRKELIQCLRRGLAEKAFTGTDEATFTYLLGEIQRQDGQTDAAVASFQHAQELGAALPKRQELDWLSRWCDEQSELTRAASTSARELEQNLSRSWLSPKDQPRKRLIALTTLAQRAQLADLKVLVHFCRNEQNASEFHEALAGQNQFLESWFQAQYRSVRSTEIRQQLDALSETMERNSSSWAGSLRYQPDAVLEGLAFQFVAWADENWLEHLDSDTEEDTNTALIAVLIRKGQPKALRLLAPYIEKRGTKQGYGVIKALRALGETPGLWPSGRQLAAGLRGPALVRECILYASGDDTLRERLRKQLWATASSSSPDWDPFLILACFEGRRDMSFKAEAIEAFRMGKDTPDGLMDYLELLCTGQDVAALEEASQSRSCRDRHEIADLILALKFEAFCHPTTRRALVP